MLYTAIFLQSQLEFVKKKEKNIQRCKVMQLHMNAAFDLHTSWILQCGKRAAPL